MSKVAYYEEGSKDSANTLLMLSAQWHTSSPYSYWLLNHNAMTSASIAMHL